MQIIRAPSLGRAHELVVEHIWKKGFERPIYHEEVGQNGEMRTVMEKTREVDGTCIVVDNPWNGEYRSARSPQGDNLYHAYADQIVNGTTGKFSYTYHDLMFNYRNVQPDHEGWYWCNFNQVQYVINELRKTPTSRQAVMSLWNPPVHSCMENCPCLNHVQFLIASGELRGTFQMRSNDMLEAAGPNMYGFMFLQKMIADELGLPIGRFQLISLVPHIYYDRDENDLIKMIGNEMFLKYK